FGYLIGRRGGRWFLMRGGLFHRERQQALERSQRFFARHGGRAVFLGRWLPWLRIFASWIAGASGMGWRRFTGWNALGGVAWATSVGLLADLGGAGGAQIVTTGGAGLSIAMVLGLGLIAVVRWRRRRQASLPVRLDGRATSISMTSRSTRATP